MNIFHCTHSKDYFFEMRKPRILSYEIGKIDYADNFTKATVLTKAQLYVKFPGFDKKPLSMPVKTQWKVVDGTLRGIWMKTCTA